MSPTARFGADDVLVIERLSPVTAVALKRMQGGLSGKARR